MCNSDDICGLEMDLCSLHHELFMWLNNRENTVLVLLRECLFGLCRMQLRRNTDAQRWILPRPPRSLSLLPLPIRGGDLPAKVMSPCPVSQPSHAWLLSRLRWLQLPGADGDKRHNIQWPAWRVSPVSVHRRLRGVSEEGVQPGHVSTPRAARLLSGLQRLHVPRPSVQPGPGLHRPRQPLRRVHLRRGDGGVPATGVPSGDLLQPHAGAMLPGVPWLPVPGSEDTRRSAIPALLRPMPGVPVPERWRVMLSEGVPPSTVPLSGSARLLRGVLGLRVPRSGASQRRAVPGPQRQLQHVPVRERQRDLPADAVPPALLHPPRPGPVLPGMLALLLQQPALRWRAALPSPYGRLPDLSVPRWQRSLPAGRLLPEYTLLPPGHHPRPMLPSVWWGLFLSGNTSRVGCFYQVTLPAWAGCKRLVNAAGCAMRAVFIR